MQFVCLTFVFVLNLSLQGHQVKLRCVRRVCHSSWHGHYGVYQLHTVVHVGQPGQDRHRHGVPDTAVHAGMIRNALFVRMSVRARSLCGFGVLHRRLRVCFFVVNFNHSRIVVLSVPTNLRVYYTSSMCASARVRVSLSIPRSVPVCDWLVFLKW